MAAKRALNVVDQTVLDRTKHYCNEVIALAQPRGRLAEFKARGEVSSRAKWLLNAIAKLEAEMEGCDLPAEPGILGNTEEEQREIEQRIAAVRNRTL